MLSNELAPTRVWAKNKEEKMNIAVTILKRFAKDESGATAIEYGLIAGLVSVALITGATTLGNKVSAQLTTVSTKLNVK